MRVFAARGAAACLAVCAALLAEPAHAAPLEVRFRCTMPGGEVRVLAQDLARLFPHAVGRCSAFEAPAAAPPQSPRTWMPPAALFGARLDADPPGAIDSSPAAGSPPSAPSYVAALVRAACTRLHLDPQLVTAVMFVESRFRPEARSPKGAIGLMQVMPATAARYGVMSAEALHDPALNVDVGTRYLRDLLDLFDGRVELMLAAYNAGEGAVMKHGNRVPPYPETRDYVRQVLSLTKAP